MHTYTSVLGKIPWMITMTQIGEEMTDMTNFEYMVI